MHTSSAQTTQTADKQSGSHEIRPSKHMSVTKSGVNEPCAHKINL